MRAFEWILLKFYNCLPKMRGQLPPMPKPDQLPQLQLRNLPLQRHLLSLSFSVPHLHIEHTMPIM